MGECYTISRFSFKRSDAHNAVVFLVTPGENDDRVLGQVTLYDDKERPFKLVVSESEVVEFYSGIATTPEIYEEKDIGKLYFPKRLPELVEQIYAESRQFADLWWSKQRASSYRFNAKIEILKPQNSTFRKTATLKKWNHSLDSCLVEPLSVVNDTNVVKTNLVIDAVNPKKGAQDVISYLVALLQCFDVPDTEQMMTLNNSFYHVIHGLMFSRYDYNEEVFTAPDFTIEVTVTRREHD